MLMPKKVKYRKQQRGRMTGKAWRGADVSFGDYGLKAMEPNDTSAPRHALPVIRPRCCLRYLTFFGINMIRYLLSPAGARRGARSRYSSSRPTRGTRRSPL